MKQLPFLLLAVMASIGSVRSEEQNPTPSKEPVPAAEQSAEIIGKLPDGTPPEPQPPKPGFVAPAEDIVATDTYREGGRTITVHEIAPIDLPPPPDIPQADGHIDPEFKRRIEALRASQPKIIHINLGATVYYSKDSPPRTLVRYWVNSDEQPIYFWSSADFSLLAGVGDFTHSDGYARRLMMMWSPIYPDRNAALLAKHGRTYAPPEIPEFPAGKATFLINSGTPDEPTRANIQALHDLYNSEYDKLLAARDGREQARLAHEAELKAHPPQPKDIVLNHWRVEPAPQEEKEGGSR